MDFPAVALLANLGISPIAIGVAWIGWQLVKINRGIQGTLLAHEKRIDKIEWEKENTPQK
ncbi:hypothetical protein [Psychromonas sp. Urea-02u-13]|uniref:hypothetical protein n=1 Tax=Psychromonas sp. Urea-02u-13 TaxID=2058326 RepID=UPI000C338F20|nr:hypothetical protein [Psychromonas sp. Urea-02u-13]PKG39697.1 hypothetical protein CXF74_07025 [Psychromonas sp. Urea-02u-13]